MYIYAASKITLLGSLGLSIGSDTSNWDIFAECASLSLLNLLVDVVNFQFVITRAYSQVPCLASICKSTSQEHFVWLICRLYYKEYRGKSACGDGADAVKAAGELEDVRTAVYADGGETVIAAVTPLMERVHSLDEAGEVVFVDTSRGVALDRCGLRVLVLMCWSPAGSLPLGVIISTSETEELVAKGLHLLMGILPEGGCITAVQVCNVHSVTVFLPRTLRCTP